MTQPHGTYAFAGRPAQVKQFGIPAQQNYVGGHLTARGRRLLALLALVPLVAALVLAGSHRAVATGTGPKTQQIVVQQGESLWDIAVEVAPDQDPRQTMWEIQQLNHMTDSGLNASQALIVPVR